MNFLDGLKDNKYYSRITRDCGQLSSGTLATISGAHLYADIDKLRMDFVAFAICHEGRFDSWIEAWQAFRGYTLGKYHSEVIGQPAGTGEHTFGAYQYIKDRFETAVLNDAALQSIFDHWYIKASVEVGNRMLAERGISLARSEDV